MALDELHRARTLIFSCKYDVVFCPKYRRKLLVPPIDHRIKEMILEKQGHYSYAVVEMELMSNMWIPGSGSMRWYEGSKGTRHTAFVRNPRG